jgi:hypothetical protein
MEYVMQRASRMNRPLASRSTLRLFGLSVALTLGLASGCGDISTPTSQRAERLLANLPAAPEAVQEQDLPGCSTAVMPADQISLATYPGARDLIVVFASGLSLCVDTPEVVLRSLGIEGDEQPLPGTPGGLHGEGDDDPVPINGAGGKAEGDDDPVPINGAGGKAEGDDDPVPINGAGSKALEGDDDPVPINGASRVGNGDDDPVPINGAGGHKVGEGDDDPVPINGRNTVRTDDGDDAGASAPINPALLKQQLL